MTEFEVIEVIEEAFEARPDLNLTTHRSSASVWDGPARSSRVDLPTIGRALAIVGGGFMMMQGLRSGRTSKGRAMVGLGTALGAWGLAGSANAVSAGHWCADFFRGVARDLDDLVLEASDESFPASDPPSWTPTTAGVRH